MSHGVHLAAILDFVIRELRKLITSITFEPSDIDTQAIPLFHWSQAWGTQYDGYFCNRDMYNASNWTKHVFKCLKSSKIRYSSYY